MRTKFFQSLKKLVSPIFLIIVFSFWIYYIIKYSNKIIQVIGKINWFWFFIAIIVFLPFYAIEIFNWRLLIKTLKGKITFFHAGKSWLLSNLAKYIPGTVWIPLSRSYLSKQVNISYGKSLVSWLFELYFHLASAIFVFCLYFLLRSRNFFEIIILVILCCLLILIPILRNYIFQSIKLIFKISFLKSYLKKFEELVSLSKTIPIKIPLLLFFRTMMIWIIQGFWLFILTYSIVGKSFAIYHFFYIWSFSWFIGFIVIFTPGGLGVREGVMLALLSKLGIAIPTAMVISILSRFQYIVLDGVVTLLFIRLIKNRS